MRKLLVALLMVPTVANAEFFSGNTLLQKLTSTDYLDKMQGLGYIQGVFDAGQHWRHCAPDNAGVTAGQIQDMVRQHLERNPANRNWAADLLILEVFKKNWPCPTQGKGRGA